MEWIVRGVTLWFGVLGLCVGALIATLARRRSFPHARRAYFLRKAFFYALSGIGFLIAGITRASAGVYLGAGALVAAPLVESVARRVRRE